MRTLVLLLATFILIVFFEQCNNDNQFPTSENNPLTVRDSAQLDPLPCCNAGKPPNCNPSFQMGLFTDIGEITISCECCREVYEFYGNPRNLYGIQIPSTLLGSYVCIPNMLE